MGEVGNDSQCGKAHLWEPQMTVTQEPVKPFHFLLLPFKLKRKKKVALQLKKIEVSILFGATFRCWLFQEHSDES